MVGYLVRCRIPLRDLGRLDFPRGRRLRYRNGYVRIVVDRDAHQLVAILEDKDGHAMPLATQTEARAESLLMGQQVALGLQRFTRYEIGDEVGDPSRVVVAQG